MKKLIIGALVAAVILFIYSFLSWSVLGLHNDMQEYTPNQEEVLKYLDDNLEEGFYFMPTVPPGSGSEAEQANMEASQGKPWAQVYLHKSFSANMGANMGRNMAINFIAMLLLCWVLLKIPGASFSDILLSTLAVGFIAYFAETYTRSIWYEFPTTSDLIDTVVGYGLIGAWLGFWLRRP